MMNGTTETNPLELLKARGGYICRPYTERGKGCRVVDSRTGEVFVRYTDGWFAEPYGEGFGPDVSLAECLPAG